MEDKRTPEKIIINKFLGKFLIEELKVKKKIKINNKSIAGKGTMEASWPSIT